MAIIECPLKAVILKMNSVSYRLPQKLCRDCGEIDVILGAAFIKFNFTKPRCCHTFIHWGYAVGISDTYGIPLML